MEKLQPKQEYLENILQLPCPSCGNQLAYSAEKQNINCTHCGFVKALDSANDMVREQCLKTATKAMQSYTPKSIAKKVIDCKACGAQLMIQDDTIATSCNFCGSKKVNEKSLDKNLIKPQGIIPFQVDKKTAETKFRDWIKEGWFKPNKLKTLANLGEIHGIYVPFWTYDTQTYTRWSGQAGFHYYVTETYTNSDGETQSRQVQKTRWEYRNGDFDKFFDDILVVASKGLPHKVITPIYPYQLEKVINYTNDLMIGWESEIYSLEVTDGYRIADKKIDEKVRDIAQKSLGGDTQKNLSLNTEKWDQTFKHIILPVWLCSYVYNNKTYQFAINGQTGKINGTKPTSWFKIIGLVLFIIALIAAISFFASQNN